MSTTPQAWLAESPCSSRPIDVRVAPDCSDLDVDPSLALEILVNLVENALHHTPGGGVVDVVLSRSADAPMLQVIERVIAITAPLLAL